MLVFIMVALTTFACNISQGQCSFVSPPVIQGMIAAGVIELFFEGAGGLVKIYRKKNNEDN